MIRYSKSLLSVRRRLVACFSLMIFTAFGTAPLFAVPPLPEKDAQSQDYFEMASVISEDRLADMRGGFSGPGFSIEFGLTSTTLVNGLAVNNFAISGSTVGNMLPQNVQQIIQTGTHNSYSSPSTLGNYVVNVLQNSENNSVIQNHNVLNLTVGNLAGLRNRTAALNSIAPMVRALH